MADIYPSMPIHPGEMIKDEIEYRGITQKKLAKELGISPSVLSEVLTGKRNLTTELALMLEAALGIEADLWLKQQMEYNKQIAMSNIKFIDKLKKIRNSASIL